MLRARYQIFAIDPALIRVNLQIGKQIGGVLYFIDDATIPIGLQKSFWVSKGKSSV